uniref:A-kinase anchor protein 7-like phosphoesterase domain-containing protein n=1 Tax=Talaromyces marneffei PM1 TaxID=1077442 RepID=A0A093V7C9_TALMA
MQAASVTNLASNNLQPKKEKRPPLTHFLCLPLVSETSLPLLENSLLKFKHNLLLARKAGGDHPSEWLPSLFPDSAIRPLGTVHLTLGVMSLTSATRIEEAAEFLKSLNVDKILQEVQSELASPGTDESTIQGVNNNPISVSLEALGALPKAKAATVLYASPVDPTSRLNPFAVKIRQAFVKAGFIEQDFMKQRPKKTKTRNQVSSSENNASNTNTNTNNNGHNGAIVAAKAAEESIIQQKPKLRPLFLHATLVNTIYAPGGRNAHHSSHPGNKAKRGRRHAGPLTFDARGLLARYRDYYIDGTCTQEKQHLPADDNAEQSSQDGGCGDDDDCASHSSEEEAHPSKGVEQIQQERDTDTPKYPFVWASNVPIERLCICEMGAKTLTEEDNHLAARLGQEYRIVTERKLF